MAFSVPESKRSIAQNRFEFEVAGTTYDIPQLKYLPVESMESFEGADPTPIRGLLAACDNDGAKNAIRKLDGEQLEALMNAWQEASGVKVGESSASEGS